MARIFVYDGRDFPDPDPNMAVDDVRRHYGEFFPELANADTKEEKRGDDTVHTFSRRIGTKGGKPDPTYGLDIYADATRDRLNQPEKIF